MTADQTWLAGFEAGYDLAAGLARAQVAEREGTAEAAELAAAKLNAFSTDADEGAPIISVSREVLADCVNVDALILSNMTEQIMRKHGLRA